MKGKSASTGRPRVAIKDLVERCKEMEDELSGLRQRVLAMQRQMERELKRRVRATR
jgi:hypothetical protein